jgi:hypothetical protein
MTAVFAVSDSVFRMDVLVNPNGRGGINSTAWHLPGGPTAVFIDIGGNHVLASAI